MNKLVQAKVYKGKEWIHRDQAVAGIGQARYHDEHYDAPVSGVAKVNASDHHYQGIQSQEVYRDMEQLKVAYGKYHDFHRPIAPGEHIPDEAHPVEFVHR